MPTRPDPTRVVADADVLLADLFGDSAARDALDRIRAHSWFDLVASPLLVADTVQAITHLADADLAKEWESLARDRFEMVDHPPEDHPALAAAYHGSAGHLLTFDDDLRSANTGLAMRSVMPLSIRSPEAFLATVDPAALYEAYVGKTYPGPDRDPRE